ncbi:uncharacterized protein LOC116344381 [Contarinia nasturtii]|uniref:uncharacterized protein LOC116344381 n=1 Tax=Contarinia nasturtii TaxID=265458 RepID=UPI0012D3C6F8|nr:uncharacterized protein LOC116344381 [Contarinia nasturtii]
MYKTPIIFALTWTIIAFDMALADIDMKSYDEIIGANEYDKESFGRFHKMLKKYCFENGTTKAIFEKTKFNKKSMKYISYTSNEFKNKCGVLYDLKKANQSVTSMTDPELAFRTLFEAVKSIYDTYERRLVGEDNSRAKTMLKEQFEEDPIKFLLSLTKRRLGLEEDIGTIQDIFENVSREEAALRTYILEKDDDDDKVDCFSCLRILRYIC